MRSRCLLALLLLGGTNGCGADRAQSRLPTSPPPEERVPVEIRVASDALVLGQRDSIQLAPVFLDKNGRPFDTITPNYATLDATIATVSSTGMVRTAGPVGQTFVRISGGGISKAIGITVTPSPTTLKLTADVTKIPQFGSARIQARVLDASGAELSDVPVAWASASPSILAVSPAGDVKSLGASGSGVIIVSTGTLSATILISVTPVPTRLTGVPSLVKIVTGEQSTLTVGVRDAVDAPIQGSITYRASDPSVATVSESGVIQAVATTGTTEVIAEFGPLTARIPVQVVAVSHPVGGSVELINTPGFPAGMAVSAQGAIYATGFLTPPMRADLPSLKFKPNVLALPATGSAVIFNKAGTRAYFAPDGEARDSTLDAMLLIAVDATRNSVLWTVSGKIGKPLDVELSPDETMAFVSTRDQRVYAIDLATRAIVWDVPVGGLPVHLTAHPTLPLLYVSGGVNNTVSEVNLQTHKVEREIVVGSDPQKVVIAPDGSELWVARKTGTLEIISSLNGGVREARSTISLSSCAGFGLALTPDGEQLYVACSVGGVVVVDRASRTIVRQVTTIGNNRRIAFNATGTMALIANGSEFILVVR